MALTKAELIATPGGPGVVGAVKAGSGVSISADGAISATSPSTYIGSSPPTGVAVGSTYWDNTLGELFIYYNDGTTSQWVQTNYGPPA